MRIEGILQLVFTHEADDFVDDFEDPDLVHRVDRGIKHEQHTRQDVGRNQLDLFYVGGLGLELKFGLLKFPPQHHFLFKRAQIFDVRIRILVLVPEGQDRVEQINYVLNHRVVAG